tara:strand:+ start:5193 stop:7586 length:2394 start_codon:yes stop_codon:yes gene_type:complete
MNILIKHSLSLCILFYLFNSQNAFSFDPWVVNDFRVEGAQRISEGTIFNYLPINLGDTLTDQRIQEAIRAIYSTGFFQNIEFRQDGDILVIVVLERPSIEAFTITGNKDIETEQLEQSLTDVGLTVGKIFDQSVLLEIKRALTEQYYSQGKYAVQVRTPIEELSDNRVRLAIEIAEGDRAKIRQINIVGNTSFGDNEILNEFELKTGSLLSFFRNDDRYSKEALEGDLEILRSFYMDRGFADFRSDSVQVAISPDKQDIFITINIIEGESYKISDIKIAGDLVVPRDEINGLILASPGQIFSQQLLTSSEELIRFRLGQDGYSFAEIIAIPELDRESNEAEITFFLDSQDRVYVRRINFNNTDNVNDEVFRREMRQLEGGYLSNTLLDRSQIRLQRLPYIESVEYETNPVLGETDLVDIDFEIEEGLPGQFGGGIGYSETWGGQLNANFIHSNFMGSGDRVALNMSGGKYSSYYTLNYTDPYKTMDGLSQTLSFSFRDITQFTSASSAFSTETYSLGANWSYPITEYQYLQFGFSYSDTEMATSFYSSEQSNEWVKSNGKVFSVAGDGDFFGTKAQTLELTTGWVYDSRNRFIFPTDGTRLGFSFNASIPGSDVEYYVANIGYTQYIPITGRWIFRVNSDLAYGNSYGNKTTAIPPYRNFFAGGPGSVRGYRESRLGPKDSWGNPYGGNIKAISQLELIIPMPEQFETSARLSLFYDIGNVFSTGGVTFRDRLGDITNEYKYNPNNLKRSFGIGVEWLAPLGLLRFSYGQPLNSTVTTERFYGDETEQFQFTVGNAF